MVFTIESDEEIDYTTDTSLQSSASILIPEQESDRLLGDRVVGTIGFCGAVALLSSTCCCFGRGCHKEEIIHTYNRHTLFGLCCPFFWRNS